MERLTKKITAIDEGTSLQVALDKLATYEDAEENGDIVYTVREAYFVKDFEIYKGKVTKISFVPLLVEEGPDFELWYSLMIYDKKTKEELLVCDKLGCTIFNTYEEALAHAIPFEIDEKIEEPELTYKGDKILL